MNLLKLKIIYMYILKHINKLFKDDWSGFYAYYLDKIEKKNSFNLIKKQKRPFGFFSVEVGYKFLELLKKYGLKKNTNFLDYGCGWGRISIPVIEYINTEKFSGVDLSKERIRLIKEYVKDAKLDHKKPLLLSNNKKTLSDLFKGKKFDMILIYAVLFHNPPKEVENILIEAKKFISKNGKILIDYVNPVPGEYFTSILGFKIKRSLKDYRLTDEEMFSILDKLNLKYKIITEFKEFHTNKIERPGLKMLALSQKK